MDAQTTSSPREMFLGAIVCSLFFLSGFPAILYQLLWQRVLLSVFGVNIESVTIIATVFILGLGVGGYVGGALSRRHSQNLLVLFFCIELAIAVVGFFSLDIINYLTRDLTSIGSLETGLFSASFLLLPTVLMGASFPLLMSQLTTWTGQTGISSGALYFTNTLGSAIACFVAAGYLFYMLGQRDSINVAVCFNLAVGLGALALVFGQNKMRSDATAAESNQKTNAELNLIVDKKLEPSLDFRTAVIAAAMLGFLALAYEIIWVRLYFYVSQGTASAFPLVLGFYLLGIAFGALLGQKLFSQKSNANNQKKLFLVGVVTVSVATFLFPPLLTRLLEWVDYWFTLPLLSLMMLLFGALFPLVIHLSIRANRSSGYYTGVLYLANVVGGSAGALITGFFLMDWLPLQNIVLCFSLVGLLIAAFFTRAHSRAPVILTALGLLALMMMTLTPPLYANFYERLLTKDDYRQGYKFAKIVEGRSGVVVATKSGNVYGNGAYDGAINTDFSREKNGIIRAYSVGLIHPKPKKVLMIGLASGSWAQVIAHHPDLDELTVVEINPAYLEIVHHSRNASLLQNPKVTLVIDDARRWLRNRSKSEKFDMIVMNTIHNWRAGSTNLLAQEFVKETKQHLFDDGIFYYNSTRSKRAQKTGLMSYPYGLRLYGIIALSQSPIKVNKARWRQQLINYSIDGQRVIDIESEQGAAALDEAMQMVDSLTGEPTRYGMEGRDSLLLSTQSSRVITMDNMGREWSRF